MVNSKAKLNTNSKTTKMNNQALESESYARQKEVMFNEVNNITVPYKLGNSFFAPTSSLPSPSRIHFTDPKTLKQPANKKTVKKWKKMVGKSKHHKFQTFLKITL